MGWDSWVMELVGRAPMAAFVKDAQGRYLFVNDFWLAAAGFTKEQVLHKTDFDLLPWEIAEKFRENDLRVLKEGRAITAEEYIVVQDLGRNVLVTKFPLGTANDPAVGGIAIDVTDRVMAVKALEQSEARFRELVEHSPDALMIYDVADDSFADVNENACRLFGYTRDEFLKLSVAEISAPFQSDGRTSMEAAATRIQDALNGAFPVFDWIHQNKKGQFLPTRVWLSNLNDGQGPKVRASILDLRDLDAATRALQAAHQELERAHRLESLGRLAGGVAHDFNNLLTVMVSSIKFLEELPPASEELREELQTLNEATTRARGLTRQLLAFAREPGGTSAPVDVDAAVSAITRTLSRLVGEDAHLELKLDAAGAHVFINPSQLDQIILNLVINAREAVSTGGHLCVSTRILKHHDPKRPWVSIVVADDGTGMTNTVKEKAFEPFFSTKAFGKGTGLGLSTVYGIVKQAGGEVCIDSDIGCGTHVHIALPTCEVPTASAEISSLANGRAARTILVVEDEAAVRRVTSRILARAGYSVLSAALPDDAITLARQHVGKIDLVLSDVVMPEMSGFELADVLSSVLGAIPVLFVSGYPSEALEARGLEAETIDLLPKPFTPIELLDRVTRRLGVDSDKPQSTDTPS